MDKLYAHLVKTYAADVMKLSADAADAGKGEVMAQEPELPGGKKKKKKNKAAVRPLFTPPYIESTRKLHCDGVHVLVSCPRFMSESPFPCDRFRGKRCGILLRLRVLCVSLCSLTTSRIWSFHYYLAISSFYII